MSIKIDQAFVQTFIDADLALEMAHENLTYEPTAGTAYAELINLPNDITPLTLNDVNQTDGVFRILLNYPANEGAITPKTKADEILSAYKVGSQVCYDGQCATVTRQYRQPGTAENGWYRIVITIGYRAYIAR